MARPSRRHGRAGTSCLRPGAAAGKPWQQRCGAAVIVAWAPLTASMGCSSSGRCCTTARMAWNCGLRRSAPSGPSSCRAGAGAGASAALPAAARLRHNALASPSQKSPTALLLAAQSRRQGPRQAPCQAGQPQTALGLRLTCWPAPAPAPAPNMSKGWSAAASGAAEPPPAACCCCCCAAGAPPAGARGTAGWSKPAHERQNGSGQSSGVRPAGSTAHRGLRRGESGSMAKANPAAGCGRRSRQQGATPRSAGRHLLGCRSLGTRQRGRGC